MKSLWMRPYVRATHNETVITTHNDTMSCAQSSKAYTSTWSWNVSSIMYLPMFR